jgi:cell wall-associated NlpC family hydrolase
MNLAGARRAFVLAWATAACATTTPTTSDLRARDESLARKIEALVRPWLGAPYKRGGTSPRGTDCSGFTKTVFAEGFGIELPRRSRDQALVGERVSLEELQPGDLVFFDLRPDRYGIDHVGVYTGGGMFAHATRSGVAYDRLADPGYMRGYRGARRVLVDRRSTEDEITRASSR